MLKRSAELCRTGVKNGALVKGNLLPADQLVILMPLAGQKHDIPGLCPVADAARIKADAFHKIAQALDMSVSDLLRMQEEVGTVYSSPEVRIYIAQLSAASREHPALQLGISPRGSIALLKAAQATALLFGRDYVLPDDIRRMAQPVLAHRLVLKPEARMKGASAEQIVQELEGVERLLNMTSDPDLIDAFIYERAALMARLRHLLRSQRELPSEEKHPARLRK